MLFLLKISLVVIYLSAVLPGFMQLSFFFINISQKLVCSNLVANALSSQYCAVKSYFIFVISIFFFVRRNKIKKKFNRAKRFPFYGSALFKYYFAINLISFVLQFAIYIIRNTFRSLNANKNVNKISNQFVVYFYASDFTCL